MDTSKRSIFFLVALVLAGVLIFFLLPQDLYAKREAVLRVGAGDDITGVLMKAVTKRSAADGSRILPGVEGEDAQSAVEGYTFVDCCSNASQFALLSQDIELGFYCSHIAMHLVNQNTDFELYGPILLNGEVVASLGPADQIRMLGYPQKRQHLAVLAEGTCPNAEEMIQMNPSSLLYAMESGELDGAVVDVTQAALAPQYTYAPLSENDYISYCLVVRKDIADTPAFVAFLEYYNETVDALNEPGAMAELLGMDEAFWAMAGTQFLNLS